MAPSEELLISADSHVIEDPHFWEERLPASLRDRAPVYPEREVGGHFQGHPGGWDPNERIKEMAVDGVSGEVLYPSFGLDLFGLQDAKLQEACFQAYNDWIGEYCSVAPDRLYGVGCIATFDIGHAVGELERCKKAGLQGAMVWEVPPPELSYATDHYDRFWAAAQDMEIPISLHILTGQPYPWPRPGRPGNLGGSQEKQPTWISPKHAVQSGRDSNTGLLHAANMLSDLLMSGVLERFPRLKLVMVEGEVSWVPFHLAQYDKAWGRPNVESELTMPPSEYFFRQFYATFLYDPPARWFFGNWATQNLMWSNDYPHPNSPWPKSREGVERDLGHLDSETRSRLLVGNVRELYGLPALTPVAV